MSEEEFKGTPNRTDPYLDWLEKDLDKNRQDLLLDLTKIQLREDYERQNPGQARRERNAILRKRRFTKITSYIILCGFIAIIIGMIIWGGMSLFNFIAGLF